MLKEEVNKLFESQLRDWDLARSNYEALAHVKVKSFDINGSTYKVQFNPARMASSSAKTDAKSISERKCFLCEENRPAQQQEIHVAREGKIEYSILVNPFPIFPRHLTIPSSCHENQFIQGRIPAMLDLAEELDDFILFYNGPKCGASAPDHFHFQAGSKGFLPIEKEWESKKAESRRVFVIESRDREDAVHSFEQIYDSMKVKKGDSEPMMNILAWYEKGKWIICIFPRKKHRPACFFAEGDENLLISPASVDLGGVFITPLEKDFNKITTSDIKTILKEI